MKTPNQSPTAVTQGQKEKVRGEVITSADKENQEAEFASIFSDLTETGVLKKLQEDSPEIFGNVKSYNEAMKILKEGKGEEKEHQNLVLYNYLTKTVAKKNAETTLSQEKEKNTKEQEQEISKKKAELEKPAQSAKKSPEKGETSSSEEHESTSTKKPQETSKETTKKEDKTGAEISAKKEAKKEKSSSQKTGFFEGIKKTFGRTTKQIGNVIKYLFAFTSGTLGMLGRSIKYIGFDILDYPFFKADHMKKIHDSYHADMKKHRKKLKWGGMKK